MLCYIQRLTCISPCCSNFDYAYVGTLNGQFPAHLLNCTKRTENQLKTLNLSFGLSGIFSVLVISFIFFMSLHFKAYRSTLQRLFLYLIVVTGLEFAVISTAIMHQFHYRGDGTVCKCLGFISQFSSTLALTLDVVIALNLLYIVYQCLVRNASQNRNVSNRQHPYGKVLEGILFLFITVFPFSYIWLPFYKGGFGFSGIGCWIRTYDDECNYVGFEAQLLIYCLGLAHDIVTIIIAIVMAVMYCSSRHQNPRMVVLMHKTLFLMVFFFVRALVFAFVGILNRFYINTSYSFYVVYATTFAPLALLPIPIGYLIYLFTNNSNTSCCYCCTLLRMSNSESHPLINHANRNQHQPSNHQTFPSNTQTLPLPDTGIGVTTDDGNDENNHPQADPVPPESSMHGIFFYLYSIFCCDYSPVKQGRSQEVLQSHNRATNHPSTRVSRPSQTESLSLLPTGIGAASDIIHDDV